MQRTSTACSSKRTTSGRRNLKAIDQTKAATSESLRALVQLHGFSVSRPYHNLYQLWSKRNKSILSS
ncbi:uncharacterized protein BDV14DRAFT_6912 [Aspergillus stella-maris]|uniref:uncharacterized protein n=1 Tax=Aspergillus stella-maris TaxID=1810926 RepID=UPI003CCD6F44